MGERLKYCEKCGQELKSRVCEFCGQESKPVAAAIQQSSNNSQNHKFRWFRSDRPKRYLAEMGLLATVALIALLVLIPSFQEGDLVAEVEPQQESEPAKITEDSPEPEDSRETDWNYDELVNHDGPEDDSLPDTSTEDSTPGNPNDDSLASDQERDRFARWLESFFRSYNLPVAEKNDGCEGGYCVRETLVFTFGEPENYLLNEIDGLVKISSHDEVSPGEQSFTFSADQEEFKFSFDNTKPGDLSTYQGDYLIRVLFPYYGTALEISNSNRIFDLSPGPAKQPEEPEGTAVGDRSRDCTSQNPTWWLECRGYGDWVSFNLPSIAENDNHGYPLDYNKIPLISSCNEVEKIGFDFDGWAATFEAASRTGATGAFVSTQYYAKNNALDINSDGVICSSQVPE